ncbi:MAG: hypothetical protein AB7S77_09235 [Desulfatirhabdiaceae bacterium]
MKRLIISTWSILAMILMVSVPVMSADMKGHSGSDMSGHSMNQMGQKGEKIHHASINGYQLTYELIDMREKMKNMPAMTNTHHLMIYIRDNTGKAVENAMVGYLVEGPGGQQKAMSTGMGSGGYGADISLKSSGNYTIKTKIVAGEVKLMDEFMFPVK